MTGSRYREVVMIHYTIYIIDDEKSIRDGITMTLETDYHVRSFAKAEPAMDVDRCQ